MCLKELGSRVPLGPNTLKNDELTHKSSESLVQPKVVPPLHSDNITEPHVSKFMALNNGDTLLGREGRLFGVVEIGSGSTGDKTPVLHRSSIEIVGDKGVELGKGIWDVEDLLVDGQGPLLDVKSKLSLLDLVLGGKDLERHSFAGKLALVLAFE